MSDLPDYTQLKAPADADPQDYSVHERRADLLRRIIDAGTPGKIVQSDLADEYDVHKSQISRDMDKIRDSVNDSLGRDATLTSRMVFDRVVGDLLDEDDWRARAKAFDIVMEWNSWLQDIGEQKRAPQRSEVDVRRRSEASFQIIDDDGDGDGDGLDLDVANASEEDWEELGFSSGPAGDFSDE